MFLAFKKALSGLAAGLLLFFASGVTAQITPRNLLQNAQAQITGDMLVPKAAFRPFPKSPGEWKNILPADMIGQLIKNGEDALTKDIKNIPATVMLEYVRTGNRSDLEQLSFPKRNQVWALMMAENVEGKGRFMDKIADVIWSICEESYWGSNAHLYLQKAGFGLADVEDPTVDLFTAETGATLAWVDYFSGDRLDKISPLLRKRISYEVKRRILAPMDTARYNWMGYGNPKAKLNNWAPWVASNYLTVNLLMETNEAKRLDNTNRAIRIVDQYINGLGNDGGCEEGPSYWAGAAGCVYDALNLLSDATGGKLSIYKDPLIVKMASYIYKTHIAGSYFVNVADAHPKLEADGLMIYRFGKDVNYMPMLGMGHYIYKASASVKPGLEQYHRTRYLYNLKALTECEAFNGTYKPADHAWISDVQMMVARNDRDLFLASHAGTNGESHNHNDVGDLIVYAGGQPVIIDVGSGTYTSKTFFSERYTLWFNNSAYHNLPTINGYQQKDGFKYQATNVKYDDHAGRSSLSMDIAKAYPAEAGIKTWDRVVAQDKIGINVTDTYQMAAPLTKLTQTFMTVCATDISTPGAIVFKTDKGPVTLKYDTALWDIVKEEMVLRTPEELGLKTYWEGKTIYRILLKSKFSDQARSYSFTIK